MLLNVYKKFQNYIHTRFWPRNHNKNALSTCAATSSTITTYLETVSICARNCQFPRKKLFVSLQVPCDTTHISDAKHWLICMKYSENVADNGTNHFSFFIYNFSFLISHFSFKIPHFSFKTCLHPSPSLTSSLTPNSLSNSRLLRCEGCEGKII